MLPFIRCSDVADSILLSCRAAAEAWEAAFVELARMQLASMAANAGLRLSFSSERSVADELARESYADVGTVRCCIPFNYCSRSGQYSAGLSLPNGLVHLQWR